MVTQLTPRGPNRLGETQSQRKVRWLACAWHLAALLATGCGNHGVSTTGLIADDPERFAVAQSSLGLVQQVGNTQPMGMAASGVVPSMMGDAGPTLPPINAGDAHLEAPLAMYYVQLDELQRYAGTSDPTLLLHDTNRVIYPITAGGLVKSSTTLELQNGVWHPVILGRPHLAQLIHFTRNAVVAGSGVAASSVKYVEAPAVVARFVGFDSGSMHMLMPILDVPGTSLRAGIAVDMANAFSQLHSLALLNDGTGVN